MAFAVWRAWSALRQTIKTLVSMTRRTAQAIVRGISGAVQTTTEAIKTSWNDTTKVITKAATASTEAVLEVGRVVKDTTRNTYNGLKNMLCGAQRFTTNTAHNIQQTVRTAWNWWNTKVPRWVRLTVYAIVIGFIIGFIIGLVLYLVLGFGPAGIIAGMSLRS